MSQPPATRHSLLIRLRDPADGRAWAEFVEVYEPLILGLARRRGLQEADAADAAQEVLLRVAQSIQRWVPDPARGSFRGWLSRVARNVVADVLADRTRRPTAAGDADLADRAAPPGDDSAVFERERRRRLFAWAADRVRRETTDLAWRAYWMTAVDGVSAAEAAGRLGTTVGTVYHFKSKVLARLRKAVEPFEGD